MIVCLPGGGRAVCLFRPRAETSHFNQNFDAQGCDQALQGYKGFFSYGNTFDNLSIYASYNRLQNQSQPQSFFFSDFTSPMGGEQKVSAAISSVDEFGNEVLYFGNEGSVESITDNLKFKLGYDRGDHGFQRYRLADVSLLAHQG